MSYHDSGGFLGSSYTSTSPGMGLLIAQGDDLAPPEPDEIEVIPNPMGISINDTPSDRSPSKIPQRNPGGEANETTPLSQDRSWHEDDQPGTSMDNPILKGYLRGQLFSTAAFGLWWVLSSPVFLALFGKDGVGLVRLVFNVSLFVVSPFAGAFAERFSVRYLLNMATATRGLVYGVVFPFLWILFESGWLGVESNGAFQALFFLFVFFDGASVATSNVVAIDCGGVDLMGQQYDVPIDDDIRNKFNSWHQIVFDGSMLILAPIVAAIQYIITREQFEETGDEKEFQANDYESFIMLVGLGGSFVILSIGCLWFYNRRIPKVKMTYTESLMSEIPKLLGAVKEGAQVFIKVPKIGWRLVFLALETALEDAMVALILPSVALAYAEGEPSAETLGSLYTSLFVAAGKIGGIIAGAGMHRYFSDASGYNFLFVFCILGGLSTGLIPLSNYFWKEELHTWAWITVFAGSFLFFLFMTIPKIGFATLLQSLASEEDASGRIFGFAATFITAADALIILGLSQLIEQCDFELALLICCGLFVFTGVSEGLLGPRLFLGSRKRQSLTKPLLDADAPAPYEF